MGRGRYLAWFVLLILAVLLGLCAPARGAGVPDGFLVRAGGSFEITGVGVHAVALQPWDGRIVIGGDFTITHGDPAVTWKNLARVNPDGTLDTAFRPLWPDGPVRAVAIERLPDPAASRIVIGGGFTGLGGVGRKGLARLLATDGTLDPTFIPVTTVLPVTVNALLLHPDGTGLVVGGNFAEIAAGVAAGNLARVSLVTPDANAAAWSNPAGIDGEVLALALHRGGIVAAGSFHSPKRLLLRLQTDGSHDATFPAAFFTPTGRIRAVAVQADGSIVAGGDFEAPEGGEPVHTYLVRLTRDGSHDATFDPAANGEVTAIAVRPDGRLLVTGLFTGFGPIPTPRSRLALLELNGNLSSSFAAGLDAPGAALTLEPDGNAIVAGAFSTAAGIPRTRLARFYPHGALDDDLAAAGLDLDGMVTAVALRPDGTATIGGQFELVAGKARSHVARLAEDFTVVPDASFAPALIIDNTPNVLLHRPDGAMVAGGNFTQVSDLPQKLVAAIDDRGGFPGGNAELVEFNDKVDAEMVTGGLRSAQAMVRVPRDTFVDGAQLEEGMVYAGGEFSNVAGVHRYLARFKKNGTKDTDFVPAAVNSPVFAIALQPDGMVLVGTKSGKVLRLDAKGNLDRDFTPTALAGPVYCLALQPDGKILVSGAFGEWSDDWSTWITRVLRLNPDGSADASFDVRASFDSNFMASVMRVTLQTDGSMLISGVFKTVKDATGVEYTRDNIARLKPDGQLDQDFDLGSFEYFGANPVNNLNSVGLQSDGRILLGGAFLWLNGGTTARLLRTVNGRAAEELSVAADGSSVTWLRSGTSPELYGVWFEHAGQPDAAVWTPLGDAQRIAGGWRLAGLDLAAAGRGVNRYVRARGYTAGERGSAGSLIESVRLYHLESLRAQVTVTAQAKTKRYGEADPELTYSFAPPLAPGDEFSGSLARAGGVGAGSYAIGQGSLALDPDRYEIVFVPATLTIEPLPVTVTAQSPSKFYGEPDPAFTVNTVPPLIPGDSFTGALSRQSGEEAGSYAIGRGTLALSPNYTLTFVAGTFTVKPLEVTVTAASKAKVYGEPDPTLTYGVVPASVTPDLFTGALSRQPGEGAGSYAIGRGTLALGPNYALTFVAGTLTVAPVPVTVTAVSKVKVYGAPDPILTFGVVPASVTPDLFTGSLSRAAGEGVGSYAIGPGTLSLGPNYALSFASGTLTVTPLSVTVTADGKSKMYGQPDPPLTFGVVPAGVTPDLFTGSLSRAAGEGVGSYAIGRGTLSLGANYALSFQGGTLSVTPAPLEVRAEDKSRRAGVENPELTVRYTGLAFFDTPASLGGAPLLTTAAGPASPSGTYPIRVALGALSSPNYSYTLFDGVLTVTGQIPQTIAFPPLPEKTYGDSDLVPAAVASSGLPVSYASSDPSIAAVAGGVLRIAGAGRVLITASQGGSALYEAAADVAREFVVHKAPLQVVADDKSRAYLNPNPPLTASYRGFVRGEGVQILSGAPLLATQATPQCEAGSYPITVAAGTLAAANYSFVPVNGTLTVYKSCQEITFPPIPERTFGDPPFIIVASACSGLPLTFTSSDPSVARVDGNVVTVTGAGTATITASQQGGGSLEGAPDRSQTFVVHRSGQTLSFSSPAQKVLGDPPFELEATASSGLSISYTSSDPQVAVVTGATVTVVGAGTTVITGVQTGNGNYLPAQAVSRPLTVALEGEAPLVLLSTLSSGGATGNPVLNLFGSASDSSGIASLTVQGRDITVDAALFSCAVPLSPGDNNVALSARDAAGNVTTQTVAVTLDALAPELEVEEPPDTSVTDLAFSPVSGRAAAGALVTMQVNDAPPVTVAMGGGAFAAQAQLFEGVNTVEFVAELNGRSSRIKRSVAFSPGLPPVAITIPAQDLRTERQSITVAGRTGGGLASGALVLEVDGTQLTPTLSGGLFSAEVPLSRTGEVRIRARATGEDGVTSTAWRNVLRVERVTGDLDGDGAVDLADAVLMLGISLGAAIPGPELLSHGDVAPLVEGVPQPDGVIDVGDLLVLLRRIVGLVHF